MDPAEMTIIGVDGGATEIRAQAVACADPNGTAPYVMIGREYSRAYEACSVFTPVAISEQLAQRERGNIQLAADELRLGRLWVEAAADVIRDAAQGAAGRPLLLGVGMPGLKTRDGRGISVMNNGPRIPDYLNALQDALRARSVNLAAPISALGSDADYCGLGEEYGNGGMFRGVKNAAYVGCGTGIADSLKLRGRLIPFDETESWLLKAWRIPSALGPTFEQLVSAAAMNDVYARLTLSTDSSCARTDSREFPEVAALAGDPIATACVAVSATVLAELLFERLWTVKNGRADARHRGDAYRNLCVIHPYRGVILDRLVIGQRLGQIYLDPRYASVFRNPLERALAALIAHSNDAELREACLSSPQAPPGKAALRPDLVRPSELRAAAALGAAVAAVQAANAHSV